MDNPIWIGSPVDVRRDEEALAALNDENDAKYWSDESGITKVDPERWAKAQEYERDTWMKHAPDASSDRDTDHLTLFDNYQTLGLFLGDVLEIGCGPFTQTRVIIRDRSASSITLLDPLLDDYRNHPHCFYNSLLPAPSLRAIPAEDLADEAAFDTIICINVLEHVRDVDVVLGNIKRALRPDGVIVMGERTYDELDVTKLYDVGHPIRIKSSVLDSFKNGFSTLHEKDDYFIARKVV